MRFVFSSSSGTMTKEKLSIRISRHEVVPPIMIEGIESIFGDFSVLALLQINVSSI
jgi:hypothetical protein